QSGARHPCSFEASDDVASHPTIDLPGTGIALLDATNRGDPMHIRSRISRFAALSLTIVAVGGCANAGGLGEILGSVLGGAGGTGGQVLAGTVRAVDTRNQQISVQQSNGQSVAVLYDQNTKVVYQNKLYAVTNLESGDQINARIQTTQ